MAITTPVAALGSLRGAVAQSLLRAAVVAGRVVAGRVVMRRAAMDRNIGALGLVRRSLLGSCAAFFMLAPPPSMAQNVDLNNPTSTQLDENRVDVLDRVTDLLRKSSRTGASFVLDQPRVEIEMLVGESRSMTVQLKNAGDEAGSVSRIEALGQIPGFEVQQSCLEQELYAGDSCAINLAFKSMDPGFFQSVVLFEVSEREGRRIEMPIAIRVAAPPPPEPARVPDAPAEEPPAEAADPAPVSPTGPSAMDVTKRYFRSGPAAASNRASPARGFVRITRSKPEAPRDPEVFGAQQARVVKRTSDTRYDENIPWAKASLPVDRTNILTADRVIKAILETPVSNIMCGQVVAVVESDVYSTTGSRPLVPAGSRIIGSCGAFASERVSIGWSRIITTDGRSVTLGEGRSETADAMGYGGALGYEFVPFYDQYVLPVFSSMIDVLSGVAIATLGKDEGLQTNDETNRTTETKSPTNEGLRIATEGIRNTVQGIIAEVRDIRRVTAVPAGSRIDVNLREDVYFPDSEDDIQIADMVWRVGSQPLARAEPQQNPATFLEPWTPGAAPGPVVVVDGRRFFVRNGVPASEQGEPRQMTQAEIDKLVQERIRAQIRQPNPDLAPVGVGAAPPVSPAQAGASQPGAYQPGAQNGVAPVGAAAPAL